MPTVASSSHRSSGRRKHRRSSSSATPSKLRSKATMGLLGLLLLTLVVSLGIIAFTMTRGEEPTASYDATAAPASFSVASTAPADSTPSAVPAPAK